jgi:hypothetical protein
MFVARRHVKTPLPERVTGVYLTWEVHEVTVIDSYESGG